MSETGDEKKCSKCGEVKSWTEFYKDKNAKSGLRSQCRVCMSANLKAREARPGIYVAEKRCTACGKVKARTAFNKDGVVKTKLKGQCKECIAAFNRTRAARPGIHIKEKTCSRCGIVKAREAFSVHNQARDKLTSECKVCLADSRRRRNYGLSQTEYEELQRRYPVCPICHNEFKGAKEPCVDHEHTTGTVRGLLCHRCNRALGGFMDDISRLQAAVDYLEMSRQFDAEYEEAVA